MSTIVIAAPLIIGLVLALVLQIRTVGGDEHYGAIGFGSVILSAADTFSSAPIADAIEPDFIVETGKSKNILDIVIKDVLIWDVKRWIPFANFLDDIIGGESVVRSMEGGITRDNTAEQSNGPTASTIAEGVFPGGNGAAVVGTAGVTGSAPTVSQTIPNFVQYWDFGIFNNEENATGEINNNAFSRVPKYDIPNSPYEVDGHTVHELLTAAHYWIWFETTNLEVTSTMGTGAMVRKMSVDVQELMFDRGTILDILTALSVRTT